MGPTATATRMGGELSFMACAGCLVAGLLVRLAISQRNRYQTWWLGAVSSVLDGLQVHKRAPIRARHAERLRLRSVIGARATWTAYPLEMILRTVWYINLYIILDIFYIYESIYIYMIGKHCKSLPYVGT